MLGAIAGDIIGSRFEYNDYRNRGKDGSGRDFRLFTEKTEFDDASDHKISKFTDDSVLTVAVADALLEGKDMADALRAWGERYPGRGYGSGFGRWLAGELTGPYQSKGNGSAMRASAAGHLAATAEQAMDLGRRSAEVTHDHPEGIKGAQAVSLGVWMLRSGADKNALRDELEKRFGYDLRKPLDWYRRTNQFSEQCEKTVPPAFAAFLEADDFESAMRNAVSVGGDSDTIACVAGAWAEAAWGVPDGIREEVLKRITPEMRNVLEKAETHARDVAGKTQAKVADILADHVEEPESASSARLSVPGGEISDAK